MTITQLPPFPHVLILLHNMFMHAKIVSIRQKNMAKSPNYNFGSSSPHDVTSI